MPTYKTAFAALSLILAFLPLSVFSAGDQKEAPLKLSVRTGDGGQEKKRHLRKIRSYLSNKGCRVDVSFIDKESPTPREIDLEFSPEPLSLAKARLTGFHLLLQARTIENKTEMGGAILVIAATGVDKLNLIKGERISFVSTSSQSGYLLPLKMLEEAGVTPNSEQSIFVGNHVGSVSMLLHGDTFAAAAAAPLARDWMTINKELAIVALTPLVETGGWWIHQRIAEAQGTLCAQAIAELSGSQLKAFPAWVGGFNPR